MGLWYEYGLPWEIEDGFWKEDGLWLTDGEEKLPESDDEGWPEISISSLPVSMRITVGMVSVGGNEVFGQRTPVEFSWAVGSMKIPLMSSLIASVSILGYDMPVLLRGDIGEDGLDASGVWGDSIAAAL